MNYTTEQLELIAIMFKIQHGEKTVGDIFSDYRMLNDSKLKDVKIDELNIGKTGFITRYVNFFHNGELIMWFSCICQELCPVLGICDIIAPGIPIDDIIKMLSFEDKI